MPELMLKPGWPAAFRRTVVTGKKGKEVSRLIVFRPRTPVEVSEAEFKALSNDIGEAIFEVERDEKNRPRFIESADVDVAPPDPNASEKELVTAEHVAHV